MILVYGGSSSIFTFYNMYQPLCLVNYNLKIHALITNCHVDLMGQHEL